ncbi:YbhN family protein [Winogradskyella sp.]|uniref:lysylphosphatidylglycerol synthase transmembrane domain-containing protein n=1 Tax=Winogradskyella sp. TaxID=1883156 RepID=UPI003517B678
MSKSKSILKVVLPLLLGVVLVWYSLSQISIPKLIQYFKDANYFWIALGVSLGVLSHVSRAYRWLFMAEPLGYKPKFANSFMAVYSAYLINLTLPRAGEVARASILTTYEDVPFDKGFGTIVAERVADTIMLLLIIGVALILEFKFIYNYFIDKFNPTTLILGGAIILVFALGLYLFVKRGSSSFAIKVKSFIKGLIEGAMSIFKMKKKMGLYFFYINYLGALCSYVLHNNICLARVE